MAWSTLLLRAAQSPMACVRWVGHSKARLYAKGMLLCRLGYSAASKDAPIALSTAVDPTHTGWAVWSGAHGRQGQSARLRSSQCHCGPRLVGYLPSHNVNATRRPPSVQCRAMACVIRAGNGEIADLVGPHGRWRGLHVKTLHPR